MNSRSRKRQLLRHAQVTKTTVQPLIEQVTETKPQRNPFELLFKQVNPLQEVTEDADEEVQVEKKQRGRPRKWFPEAPPGQHTHKIENDDTVCKKTINPNILLKMIADFRHHYVVNQIPLNRSLERICTSYNIGYKQAFTALQGEF